MARTHGTRTRKDHIRRKVKKTITQRQEKQTTEVIMFYPADTAEDTNREVTKKKAADIIERYQSNGNQSKQRSESC